MQNSALEKSRVEGALDHNLIIPSGRDCVSEKIVTKKNSSVFAAVVMGERSVCFILL